MTYTSYGRHFARLGDLYSRVSVIVDYGIRLEIQDIIGVESKEEKRLGDSWNVLKNIIPNFAEHMCKLAQDRRTRNQACMMINKARDGCRSDDTGGLKKDIISYMMVSRDTAVSPPIPSTGSKMVRGWSHVQTAALLCPIEYDATAETYTRILSGALRVTADQFPRFLYPDGHIYDPEDLTKGILLGHLGLRVAKHIFQGPSAAMQGPGYCRGKGGNASIHGITTMTGRSIPYIACQARFAISSAESWASSDLGFSYETFYWNIVKLFDSGEGQDIIDEYNYQIFGTTRTTVPSSNEQRLPVVSSFDLLQQQRAAKRARIASQSSGDGQDGSEGLENGGDAGDAPGAGEGSGSADDGGEGIGAQ
ncbi:hypothetical protein FPV67DRAFT_1549128 [Lyophyllum atratum]|nr:hypothetical protein FPV67DRAFT_1549128 [Lyophyllum atratum]